MTVSFSDRLYEMFDKFSSPLVNSQLIFKVLATLILQVNSTRNQNYRTKTDNDY